MMADSKQRSGFRHPVFRFGSIPSEKAPKSSKGWIRGFKKAGKVTLISFGLYIGGNVVWSLVNNRIELMYQDNEIN